MFLQLLLLTDHVNNQTSLSFPTLLQVSYLYTIPDPNYYPYPNSNWVTGSGTMEFRNPEIASASS